MVLGGVSQLKGEKKLVNNLSNHGPIRATLRSSAGPVQAEWQSGKLVAVCLGEKGNQSRNLPDDFRAFLDDLKRYLDGERVRFKVSMNPGVQPPFIEKVLRECSRIPYGQSRSYAQLAEASGNPLAARAVGQAMARNPIPIVIPCHRVLTSDGRLGGFGCGLEWKRFLLKLEGISWKE